jgi:hypothetical protein
MGGSTTNSLREKKMSHPRTMRSNFYYVFLYIDA